MSKFDKFILGVAWTAGMVVAAVLVGMPFVVYADFGFSGPFLLSSGLLLFVVLVIWCGI